MPTRYLKDSARTSKNLCAVADFSERLFWRLITTADDFGRFMACPAIVKGTCFPLCETMRSTKVAHALADLQTHHLIRLYTVGDRQYGWFLNWDRHQGPPRAKSSKYPEIPHSADSCMQMPTVAGDHGSGPDTDTDTNPSSSGGEKILKKRGNGQTRKPECPIPDDWTPKENHQKFATARGLELNLEAVHFKGRAKEKQWHTADWDQKFTNWMLQEVKFRQQRRAT